MEAKRWIGIIVILILLASVSVYVFASEAKQDGENDSKLSITDQVGRTVELPDKVNSIVATGPGALRFLSYLDAADRVVGVEQVEKTWARELPYNIANSSHLSDVPVIGPPFGGDPELITNQNPDVIFWRLASAGQADDLQSKTGIPVVVLGAGGVVDPWKDNTFYKSLKLIGKVLDKEKRAEEVIQFIEKTIQDLKDRTRDVSEDEKEGSYVGAIAWGKSAKGITSTMPNYEPFRFVNAKNVARNIDQWHANVSEEEILGWDPDYIFIDQDGFSSAIETLSGPEYQSVNALEEGEVYRIWPYHSYEINFGMILINSYYTGKTLYPERFNDVIIEEKANDIFEGVLGARIYENVVEKIGPLTKVELE